MKIIFYKVTDDRIVMNKDISGTHKIKEVTGTWKTDCNVLEPNIEVAYDGSLMSANYCYIGDFGRYYFLEPPVLSTQRMLFKCSVDVLKSYADDIKKLRCVIARQQDPEYHSNRYLNDGMFRALQPKNVLTFNFPNSFSTDGALVLAVGGHA